MVKKTPLSEQADQEPTQLPSPPTNLLDEPVASSDLVADVRDEPYVTEPVTAKQMAELQAEADRENTKQTFVRKVMEARKEAEAPPPPPQPVAPAIIKQTHAEMAAGQRAVERHVEHQRIHGRVKPEAPKSEAVFRPGDYVPDQKKGQGHLTSRTQAV